MHYYGVDFTSAPSRQKQIFIAEGRVKNATVAVSRLHELMWPAFEKLLVATENWVMGVDFPLGLPFDFLQWARWCDVSGMSVIENVESLGKKNFSQMIYEFMRSRPAGKKLPLRVTDVVFSGKSPLMLAFVPLAKMYFEGATRLARAHCALFSFVEARADFDPKNPQEDWWYWKNQERRVVEIYPASFVRQVFGAQFVYKGKLDIHKDRRRQILEFLKSDECVKKTGVRLQISDLTSEPTLPVRHWQQVKSEGWIFGG